MSKTRNKAEMSLSKCHCLYERPTAQIQSTFNHTQTRLEANPLLAAAEIWARRDCWRRDKGKRTTNLRSETTGEPALEEGERDGFCIASRWFGGGDGRLTGCRAGIRTDKIEPTQSVHTKRNRNRARTARRRIRRGRRVDREDDRLCQRQRELGQSLRNHHWLVQKDQKLSRQGRPQAGRPADDDLHRDRRHRVRISS